MLQKKNPEHLLFSWKEAKCNKLTLLSTYGFNAISCIIILTSFISAHYLLTIWILPYLKGDCYYGRFLWLKIFWAFNFLTSAVQLLSFHVYKGPCKTIVLLLCNMLFHMSCCFSCWERIAFLWSKIFLLAWGFVLWKMVNFDLPWL